MPRVRDYITPKQKNFANEYVANNFNGTQAALKTYGRPGKVLSRTVAGDIASENLTKPAVRQEISAILSKAGLSQESIASKLATAIDSGLGQKATNADALRGLEMAAKFMQMYPAERKVTQSFEYRYSKLDQAGLTAELEQTRAKTEALLKDSA